MRTKIIFLLTVFVIGFSTANSYGNYNTKPVSKIPEITITTTIICYSLGKPMFTDTVNGKIDFDKVKGIFYYTKTEPRIRVKLKADCIVTESY